MRQLTDGGTKECVALMGGIYANAGALNAAITDARDQGAQRLYCLGDLGGFGPNPDGIFPILAECGVRSIAGNYEVALGQRLDDCICGYTSPRDNHFAALSYEYTAQMTNERYKAWFSRLPRRTRLRVGRFHILLCHGSPRRINEFLWESTTPDATLALWLKQFDVDAVAFTHTGLPWTRHLSDGVAINVGAVGRPANDGDTRTRYALLWAGAEGVEVEIRKVTYDVTAMAAAMERESLPQEFIETITTGWWTNCLECLPAKERARSRF